MNKESNYEEHVFEVEVLVDNYYGFEYEVEEFDEADEDSEHPFDAEKIRIDQQMLSLKYLVELMKEKQLVLNPGFQRNKVWRERKRKSLLIESLMLRIPIPAFYFYENEDSQFIVIDGLQRLSTLKEFIDGEFRLSGLEYLEKQCGGKTFSELEIKYQQRIYRTQVAVNILDARSPSNVVFDIFRRVNTGGISLKPQEIRNAISKHRTRTLLKTLYNSKEFQDATRKRIKDDRMDGQELILRFYAFYKAYDYEKGELDYKTGNIAAFLDSALLSLNEASSDEIAMFEKDFKRAMKISLDIFGSYTFRKCYLDTDWLKKERELVYSRVDIINKALYTSWGVILADPKYINFDFSDYGERILNKLAAELTFFGEYNTMLTQGTNSTRSVQYCFSKANKMLTEVIGNDF